MISLCCILVGCYLVVDSMYLASHANKERRTCLIARYVGAMMCGLYLVAIPAAEFLVKNNVISIQGHRFLSEDALTVMLLFGVTVALFMWGDTFYRALWWLRSRHEHWYQAVTAHFDIPQRRREG